MEKYDSLAELASVLDTVSLPLQLPGATQAREIQTRGVRRLEDHILPRLSNLDAPLLCVVGGSTGAGKSTIVNSLVNQKVAASSARRPTTRRPLLLHRPDDDRWFEPDRILPTLPRRRIDADAPPSEPNADSVFELELRENEAIRPGLALLDAPDLDSVVENNRKLARQLLDAADLWVFVTTAARYADAVPWAMLEDAARRNISVAVVLNRVPAGALEEVRDDFSRMLLDANLGRAPLIAIEETELVDGMIPAQKLQPLTNWLASLTDTAQARAATAKRTLHGSVDALLDSVDGLIESLSEQAVVVTDAAQVIDTEIDAAIRRVAEQTQNGSLLRGEVLARWQEVVGTAELSKKIDEGISWVKARITGFFTGNPVKAEPVEQAIGEGLSALLSDEIARTHDAIRATWHQNRAMRDVEAEVPDATVQQIHEVATEMTLNWQKELLEMVRDQAGSKKMSARFLAIGVNVLGVALMIVIFASTSGLTGAEVGVAGATSVVAQRLLESVFGDQAVQAMTKQAHDSLLEDLREVLRKSTQPFLDQIPEVSSPETLFEASTRARTAWREVNHEDL